MTKIQEELDEVTAKIESAKKQLLEGKIDQQNFNLCTRDWVKKQKDLDKQLRKMQKDVESMR